MKKKYVLVILVGITVLIAGFCYSCSYQGSESAVLLKADAQDTNASAALREASKENEIIEEKSISESETRNPTQQMMQPIQTEAEAASGLKIYVHICGAVVEPGVYEVEEATILNEVVKLSGGFTKDAADDYVNLAARVYDGQRIYIPTKKEIADLTPEEYAKGDLSLNETPVKQEPSKQQDILININTAGATELMELPGIGQAKAESIITYRKEVGQFQKAEELMNIPGIKEGLFRKIAPYVTVQ